MLKIERLSKQFGTKTAVDNVNIIADEPLMIGIIGRSGAGKSTLLRVMNRMEDPTSGTIAYNGTIVSEATGAAMRAWQSRCAMIFQQFNLVPRMDVVSNVLHGTLNRSSTLATMFNIYPQSDIHQAIEILDRLGIVEQAAKRADALSGGQQQRVAIARALMQDPEIILADEPIASLDPMNAQVVMQSLRDIHEQDGRMVIANLLRLQERNGARHEAGAVAEARRLGAVLASHDDTTAAHVSTSNANGVGFAEFPTTLEAAKACRDAGIAVMMGAPNLVRGCSHSGNIAALQLAKANLLDIVSSDYVPSALLLSAFHLAGIWNDLPRAISCVTRAPAEAAALAERGVLQKGYRADLLRVRSINNVPRIACVWVRGLRVA